MPLTNLTVKNAKPTNKTQKLFDGGGLFLQVFPNGGKCWRLKYRFLNKEKLLSFGVYPEVSLLEARARRDSAKKLLKTGVDPSELRKLTKQQQILSAEDSFESITREWYLKHSANWAESHSSRIIRRFERDIFPWLGNVAITNISTPEVLAAVRRIEDRGAVETAHRALANCGQVFRYAIATGRAQQDPTLALKGALPPVKKSHFASVTEPKDVARILSIIDTYQGTLVVRCAMKLAPLVFVRPGELRHAKWNDIDIDNGEWRFVASKTDTQHIVPLSTQAIAILEEIHPLTGRGHFVFPGARSIKRPMSDNAILAAFRSLGISKNEMSGHGFRAMARTILDEQLGFRPDYIEHQLAHAVRDPNGRAYNRTAHIEERKKMMQAWSDYLDQIKISHGQNIDD